MGYDCDTACPACGNTLSDMQYRAARTRLTLAGVVLRRALPARLAHRCDRCKHRWTRATVADGGAVIPRRPTGWR